MTTGEVARNIPYFFEITINLHFLFDMTRKVAYHNTVNGPKHKNIFAKSNAFSKEK